MFRAPPKLLCDSMNMDIDRKFLPLQTLYGKHIWISFKIIHDAALYSHATLTSRANMRTQLIVLGPIPGNCPRYVLISSVGISRRCSKQHFPDESSKVCKMCLIRLVLIAARPPTLMLSSTALSSAFKTPSYVGNCSFRELKALMLVLSVVFWDNSVRTRESRTDQLVVQQSSPSVPSKGDFGSGNPWIVAKASTTACR